MTRDYAVYFLVFLLFLIPIPFLFLLSVLSICLLAAVIHCAINISYLFSIFLMCKQRVNFRCFIFICIQYNTIQFKQPLLCGNFPVLYLNTACFSQAYVNGNSRRCDRVGFVSSSIGLIVSRIAAASSSLRT